MVVNKIPRNLSAREINLLLIIDAYPFGPNLRAHQKSTGEKGDIRSFRIFSEPYRELNSKMPLPLQAVLARMGRILIQGSALTIPIRRNRTLGAGQTL